MCDFYKKMKEIQHVFFLASSLYCTCSIIFDCTFPAASAESMLNISVCKSINVAEKEAGGFDLESIKRFLRKCCLKWVRQRKSPTPEDTEAIFETDYPTQQVFTVLFTMVLKFLRTQCLL